MAPLRFAVVSSVLLALCAAPAGAFPLIDSSEETHASVCIGSSDTPERLIEICGIALSGSGHTSEELARMEESLGFAYYETDRLEEARAVFEATLARDPDEDRAIRGLGWVLHDKGDYAAASDQFRRALDISASASALAGLGLSLWDLEQIGFDELMTYLDAALAINPGYDWARREKGWRLLEVNRAAEARDLFATFLEEAPWDANALAGLAKSYKALGEHEKVIEQTGRALEDDMDRAYFLDLRIGSLFVLERYRQVIRDADALVEASPETHEGYIWRARAMSELGRGSDALAYLASAEEILGPDIFVVYWRAKLMMHHGQYEKAALQIGRNIAGDEVDTYDYELLGYIEYNRKDMAAARRAIDHSLELDATNASAVLLDAILMLQEEAGVEAALPRFEEAMALGLSRNGISEFAGELVGAGYFMHAIAIRAKHPG